MTSKRALVARRARHAFPGIARFGCGLFLLLSSCALTPAHEESLPSLDSDVRAGISAVTVAAVAGPDGAQHGAVKPVSPGEAAGAWALGSTLESATVDPFLLPIGALIGIFGAPIAAATGSISSQKIESAEQAIRGVLVDSALIDSLRANVAAPLRASGRYDVREDAATGLLLVLYGPSLEVATDGASQPLMRVRGMLTRNGSCLLDRFWAWNGKSADFFDLAAGGGNALRIQLSKGMNQLGGAIAEDLFLSSAPRKVRYRDSAIVGKDLPVMVEKPADHQDMLGAWPSTVDPAIAAPCAPVVPQHVPQIDGGDSHRD